MEHIAAVAKESPWLTFFLLLAALIGAAAAVHSLLAVFCRVLRALMVLARGWPPAHLDADGDIDTM